MNKKFWLPLCFAIVFVGGLWVGNYLQSIGRVKTAGQQKLMEVLNLIQDKYVDEVDMDSLVELAIPALLSNLDPHSSYIPAAESEAVNNELESKFSGIGISFQIMNDTINVIEVISGGPSEKVGILPGDRIIEVDGEPITGSKITNNDVFSKLRGDKGTHVTITVQRTTSKKPLHFEIVRDDIPVESVDAAYLLQDSIGYVRVSRFARTTYEEFLNACNKLRLQGAQSFILDLRYNSGGYMEPAVLMANEFLERGQLIVSTKGRNTRENSILIGDGSGVFQDYPLAVLVNEFSASASEIFSGAMQDNDRAWIIGRRTFGKGLVQHPITLPDSSEVRLTVQRYYTPSGRSIQKKYTPGDINDYESELVNRFVNGESLNQDSIKLNTEDWYLTMGGRTVYGGGGIMPDVFVPEDTSHVTSYYRDVFNHGLFNKFAYEYCDLNRQDLQRAKSVDELLTMLPNNDVLLNSFVNYAAQNGVPRRWYYINISAPLIVNQLQAFIARHAMGLSAYYEVFNRTDSAVLQAIEQLQKPIVTNDSNE